MTNFKRIIDTQVLNYRRAHFGQQPAKLDYVTLGIRAIISIVTKNENYLYNNNYRNGLHNIKKRFISLQDRTIRKENLANQINYDRDSFPSSQYILSPDEFTRSINENGELQLNDTVFVDGDLDLSKFANIKKLPDKLFVDGDLILSGCSELQALSSKELKVTGSLRADNCKSLRQVTKNIHVGGDINFESCVHLDQLPKNITHAGYKFDSTQRRINLKDTAISPKCNFFNKTCRSAANRFNQSENAAYSFEFSNPLDIFIRRFIHESGESDSFPLLRLPQVEEQKLVTWLERKMNSLNFIAFNRRNQPHKKIAIQQVIDILKHIEKNPEDRGVIIDSMINNIGLATDLIYIERQLLLDRGKRAAAEGDEQKIKDLFKQDRQLYLLRKFERDIFKGENYARVLNMSIIELRQGLSKYLDLPFKFHTDENQTHSVINEADIQKALNYINDNCEDTDLEIFIDDWEPWTLFKRCPAYNSLEVCDHPPEDQRCMISLEHEKDMVVYKKHSFSYRNFIKNFMVRGKDPFGYYFHWREVERYTAKPDTDQQDSTDSLH